MKILIGIVVVILVFLIFVSTRESKFRYERSTVISAPAEKIFPYLSDFHLGTRWNPYDQKDPNMKRTFKGPGNQVGSIMEFDGNREAGSGQLEMMKIVSNDSVTILLTMTKPIAAQNTIEYKLTPEGSGTRFSWSMSGDGGFMGKLIGVFVDCEKMLTVDMDKGIANLKAIVETSK